MAVSVLGAAHGSLAAEGVNARPSLERAGSPPVAGEQFRVVAAVESVGGDNPPFDYALALAIDPGLELVEIKQEFGAAQCQRAGQSVICTGNVIGRDISESYQLDLRAARAGSYAIRAALTVVGGTDLDPSDNTDELTVDVGAAPAAIAAFRTTPARPVAGRAFVATLLLGRSGSPVRPSGGACRATLSGRSLRGRRTLLPGGVRCAWALGRGARGKRLAGSVSASADGATFSRRFGGTVR